MSRRVVITGLGLITAAGSDPESFWARVLSGPSAATPVTTFDTGGFRNAVGCEVKDFTSPTRRATKMGMAAALQAVASSGLDHARPQPERVGVTIGTTLGEALSIERVDLPENADSLGSQAAVFLDVSTAEISCAVADCVHARGPVRSVPAACAAGNHAIALGFELIRRNRADLVFAGGAEGFSRLAFIGFSRLHAMSPDLCRPFDRNRKGLILGEGAAVLVLEDYEHARRRGADIRAEVLGYGLSCDAHHITTPHPEGDGAALAMMRALKSAGVSPEAVDYINAHGTGTKQNDMSETLATKKAFGSHAYRVPISSTKAVIGHAMGAAGAIEAVVCVLALQHGVVPPTHHLEMPDPDCDLDYTPREPREKPLSIAMNNSYAFGGNNASLVLRRFVG
jgi:3-oxoacyl-[acyl-carrier-protein] synthase II